MQREFNRIVQLFFPAIPVIIFTGSGIMKKIITIDELMAAAVAALGYGYMDTFAKLFRWPWYIALLACLFVGMTLEPLIHRIVFSKAVQKKKRNRIFTYIAIVLLFLVAHSISSRWMGASMLQYLTEQFIYVIAFPVLGFFINLLLRQYRISRVKERYGDGSRGYIYDLEEKEIQEANQQNQRLFGQYDADCAVKIRTGIYVGEKDLEFLSYLGIPYAKPPVGKLRWKAPEPLPSSDMVWEARHFGASAIQVQHKGVILTEHRQSEDCLTLNITVSTKQTEARKPVLVLFHNGDFSFGGSTDPLLHGTEFVKTHPDVVFVSFNYRLGIFGFIDFSEVPGGENYPDANNLGLLDQIEALKWIQENIAAFGGDPDRVTVLGFESGAVSISLLSVCPQAKGLFRKAFLFNGSPENAYTTSENARILARDLLKETHASTMDDLCQMSSETLKEAAQKLWLNLCAPSCDNRLIPADIYRAWQNGAASDIEFIIGIPRNEMLIYRSFVGNKNYIDGLSRAVEDEQKTMDASTVGAIQAYVETQMASCTELEATSRLAEQWLAANLYRCAAVLAERGNKVHLLYWDEKPIIENLGAGSTDVAATLLGNSETLQMYGSVINADVSEVLQAFLVKFINGESLKLIHNEIKGIDSIHWKAFPRALTVSEGNIESDRIEKKISRIPGLLDCLVKKN